MPGFFGLSSPASEEFDKNLTELTNNFYDEFYFMIKRGLIFPTFGDVWNWPTPLRRFMIQKEIKTIEKENEQFN